MGLIKAVKDAVGGVFADQWREYFYSDSLENDVLVVYGANKHINNFLRSVGVKVH